MSKGGSDRAKEPGERLREPARDEPASSDDWEDSDEGADPDAAKCGSCGAASPKGYRFCLSCGAVLQSKKRPKEVKKAPPAKPIARATAKPGAATITCERCRGECSGSEAFCKFCGAPLGKSKKGTHKPSDKPAAHAVDQPLPLQKSAEGEKRRKSPTDRPSLKSSSPEAPVTGKLVVIVEDGSEGRELKLSGQQVDIGSRDGDIVLSEDRYLSPRHARFFRQDDRWYLRDLDSLNGVYRRLRKPEVLHNRDLVLLGLEVLQFEMVDHAERGLGHAIQGGTLVFGSPATTRRARLCQRTVEGVVRDVYHLVAEETTVGREIGDIVFTSDPFMSRRHAVIRWQDATQEYVLADLNSSNGTYLAIRDDVQLDNGDFIRLGQHLFRVDLPQRAGRAR